MPRGGSNKCLSVREAAEHLGIAVGTLRNSYRKWGLEVVRVGGSIKFRERELERYLDEHTEKCA